MCNTYCHVTIGMHSCRPCRCMFSRHLGVLFIHESIQRSVQIHRASYFQVVQPAASDTVAAPLARTDARSTCRLCSSVRQHPYWVSDHNYRGLEWGCLRRDPGPLGYLTAARVPSAGYPRVHGEGHCLAAAHVPGAAGMSVVLWARLEVLLLKPAEVFMLPELAASVQLKLVASQWHPLDEIIAV